MRLNSRMTHPVVPARSAATEPDPNHLVVTVTGDDTTSDLRPRVALIPVVDTSGSMGAERKLHLVCAALDHVAGELCSEDQVALITFASDVMRPLRPIDADEHGIAVFRRQVQATRAGGGTALAEALRAAVATAAGVPEDIVVRILLLTDGQANVGERHPDMIARIVDDLPGNVTVSAIGVGSSCDHDLLARIAETGRGSYGFVETAVDIPGVIGADLGGLLSAVAANVTVDVHARRCATLTPVGFTCEEIAASTDQRPGGKPALGAGWRVRLGSLGAGQTRHLVFAVNFDAPRRGQVRPVTVADVFASGTVDDKPAHVESLPKVRFANDDPDGFATDDELTGIVDRALLSEAQRHAELAAAAGAYDEATAALHAVQFHSAGVAALRDSLAVSYNDAATFALAAPTRASARSMLGATTSLAGSSQSFDALAARTVGSYTTDAQRDFSARTVRSTGVTADPDSDGEDQR